MLFRIKQLSLFNVIFKLCRKKKRAKCQQVYLESLGCLKIKEFLLPLEWKSESYHICLIIIDNRVAVLLFLRCSKTFVCFSFTCGDDFCFLSETL